jgi:hypothetical protein
VGLLVLAFPALARYDAAALRAPEPEPAAAA